MARSHTTLLSLSALLSLMFFLLCIKGVFAETLPTAPAPENARAESEEEPSSQQISPSTMLSAASISKAFSKEHFSSLLAPVLDLIHENKNDEAKKTLRKIRQDHHRLRIEGELALLAALVAFNEKKPLSAYRFLRQAQGSWGSNSDVLLLLAMLEAGNNEHARALQLIEESLWFDRFRAFERSRALVTKAKSLEALGQKEKSIAALESALQANPKLPQARLALAQDKLAQGEQAKALEILEELHQDFPQETGYTLQLAQALLSNRTRSLHQSELQKALKLTTNLFELEDLPPSFQNTLAPVHIRALIENEKLEEAKRVLQGKLQGNSTDPVLLALQQQIAVEEATQQAQKEVESE